jgi:hypothetical protein
MRDPGKPQISQVPALAVAHSPTAIPAENQAPKIALRLSPRRCSKARQSWPGEAWDLLRKSGSECVRPAYARVMREVVARRIFDLAQGGISDKKQLAYGAVRFLNENYRHENKGPCWETIAA